MKYESKGVKIEAEDIQIDEGVTFGNGVNIKVKGTFSIGARSHLGNNVYIRGNNIIIGKDLFHSQGLHVGGGGRQNPQSMLVIGDRCTLHNNFINISEPVTIGNDVGLSADVDIITHGYWMSVLDGFPAKFEGVRIGNRVIVGYRSLIMMGVNIHSDIVVGAQSVVTKSLTEMGVYAGSPARLISEIKPLSVKDQEAKVSEIIEEWVECIAPYHNIPSPDVKIDFPWVEMDGFRFNVKTHHYEGEETIRTDDLRDFIRKFGIRIYTNRPFKSNFEF